MRSFFCAGFGNPATPTGPGPRDSYHEAHDLPPTPGSKNWATKASAYIPPYQVALPFYHPAGANSFIPFSALPVYKYAFFRLMRARQGKFKMAMRSKILICF